MLTLSKPSDDSPLDIKDMKQARREEKKKKKKKANGPKPPAMLPSKVVFLEN